VRPVSPATSSRRIWNYSRKPRKEVLYPSEISNSTLYDRQTFFTAFWRFFFKNTLKRSGKDLKYFKMRIGAIVNQNKVFKFAVSNN
jgi:hypothetical protein